METLTHCEWRRDSEHHVDMESHCEHGEDRECTHYEHHVELECVIRLFKPLNKIPGISVEI